MIKYECGGKILMDLYLTNIAHFFLPGEYTFILLEGSDPMKGILICHIDTESAI